MEFSDKILKYFEKNGITQSKIAKEIGIDKSTFSKWKSKPTSKIDLDITYKIAEYLNISIDDLLSDIDINQHNLKIEFSDKEPAKINLEPKDNLRYLQDELTDLEMAQIGGISEETYKKYLSGATPSIQSLINYSKFFKVSINHILGISYTNEKLSIEELELLNTYRNIDYYGKYATKSIAYIEQHRMTDLEHTSTENATESDDVFDGGESDFYMTLNNLCAKHNTNIIAVLNVLGFQTKSRAWCMAWRNGAIPTGDILTKLSRYFNVSADYLLGNEDNSVEDTVKTYLFGTTNVDDDVFNQVKQYAKFIYQERTSAHIAASGGGKISVSSSKKTKEELDRLEAAQNSRKEADEIKKKLKK